jgi:hypothetical protein
MKNKMIEKAAKFISSGRNVECFLKFEERNFSEYVPFDFKDIPIYGKR